MQDGSLLHGQVPTYGDWDEGRALASSGDPADVTGSILLALSLAGSGSRDSWRVDHDEVAWYSHVGQPEEPPGAESEGRDVGGGFARIARGPFTSWLKAGTGPSHGHADLCSVMVAINGEWVVGDPGTGSYNRTHAERDYFRSSVAHSVLRLEGQDQLVPQSSFRWRHTAHGSVGSPTSLEGLVLAWGFHDAYHRLEPPRRICRAVFCSDDGVAALSTGSRGRPVLALNCRSHSAQGQRGATALSMPATDEPVAQLPGEARLRRGDGEFPGGRWSSHGWDARQSRVGHCVRYNRRSGCVAAEPDRPACVADRRRRDRDCRWHPWLCRVGASSAAAAR